MNIDEERREKENKQTGVGIDVPIRHHPTIGDIMTLNDTNRLGARVAEMAQRFRMFSSLPY